jgi:hypothetical protein
MNTIHGTPSLVRHSSAGRNYVASECVELQASEVDMRAVCSLLLRLPASRSAPRPILVVDVSYCNPHPVFLSSLLALEHPTTHSPAEKYHSTYVNLLQL